MTSARFATQSQMSQAPRPASAIRPGVRDQILEAALAEFADKGFQEASLASIARHVGVTAPLVLYHFGSKANLWREALEVFCANLGAAVDQAIVEGRGLDGREGLRRLVRGLVLFFSTHRAAYRLLREEGAADSGGGEWFASRSLRPVVEKIEAAWQRAVDEGSVRPAPFGTTLFMILGAASCYLESRSLASRLFGAVDEGGDWTSDYADQVVRLCFDGLSTGSRRGDRPSPMLAALRGQTIPVSVSTIPTEAAHA